MLRNKRLALRTWHACVRCETTHERREDGVLGRPARQLAGRLVRHAVADPRLRALPTAT